MDIRSGGGYPSSSLSNFAPHPFEMDGVTCASMEGFLQALKFKEPHMQKYVCSLIGRMAKGKGKNKNWQQNQTLYWNGVEYRRDSLEYRNLIERAYTELGKNTSFRQALLSTHDAKLTHSMGRSNIKETVLTEREFIRNLERLRYVFQNQVKFEDD